MNSFGLPFVQECARAQNVFSKPKGTFRKSLAKELNLLYKLNSQNDFIIWINICVDFSVSFSFTFSFWRAGLAQCKRAMQLSR